MEIADAPVQEPYRDKMRKAAGDLDTLFNGKLVGENRTTGFVLLVFPYGEDSHGVNYISNGLGRKDAVVLMKRLIARLESHPTTPGHA
jgi:hypothetical protein